MKTASKQEIIQWLEKAQNYLSSKPAMIFKATGILLHQRYFSTAWKWWRKEWREKEDEEDPFHSCSDQEDSNSF